MTERRRLPRRYGHGGGGFPEEGAIIKDWGGRLPVALVYPNSYYVGMSNLGIHTIYRLLNAQPRIACERVFLDTTLKKIPVSVESGRPLDQFAVIAFSISYELDCFNVVRILKNAGIPLFSADRDESHPLVIAGGACVTANPAPVAPFFDALAIGEAEAILPALTGVLLEDIHERRHGLLRRLSGLTGLYVPAFPQPKVRRAVARDLEPSPSSSAVITTATELGDLFLIEAERGCPRACRFCMVSTAFSPMRWRTAENILKQAQEGMAYRRRIGLVGPAVTDHPEIEEILEGLIGLNAEISLSSLRLDRLSEKTLDALEKGNAKTITLAPEAGTERLRLLINKTITDDDILTAIDIIARCPFHSLKLYFIIGLPTETEEDVQGIVRLTLRIKERLERHGSGIRITLNAAPFVPKAGTPFQWLPMADTTTLNHHLGILRKSLPARGIRINEESPAWSQVQAALSRGDEKLATALAETEEMTLAAWHRTAARHQLDVEYYSNKMWDPASRLPWDFIDSGTPKERLRKELGEALGIGY